MKRMINASVALLLLLVVGACNKEETEDPINTSQIRQVEDFVDARDGHVYRCVQIGDQIWMVDNLAYYLPKGTNEGCYTWNEKILTKDNMNIDDLSNEEYSRVYLEELDVPGNDWPTLIGFPLATLKMVPSMINTYGGITKLEQSMIKRKPAFADLFELVHLRAVEECAYSFMQVVEQKNGNYSQTHGYLYSLDGAKKAVPEGWRIPSDADWKKLESVLGMDASDLDKMNGWRGKNCGDYLKEGGMSLFNARMAGCSAYLNGSSYLYIRKDEGAYYWTSDVEEIRGTLPADEEQADTIPSDSIDNTGIIRQGIIREVAIFSSQIWRGTTRLDNTYHDMAYSVRCVKDAD